MSESKVNTRTVGELLQLYENLLDKLPDEKPLKAKLIETPLGQIFAVSNERALVFVIFADSRHFDREIKNFIKIHSKAIVDEEVKPLKSLESEINAYFDGKLKEFDTPYEIDAAGTEFQRNIWEEIRKIDYGKSITFADLAKAVGKPGAAQPVANAAGRNPISLIIPSHRVLSATKTNETGNSCIVRREWLLNHERKFAKKN